MILDATGQAGLMIGWLRPEQFDGVSIMAGNFQVFRLTSWATRLPVAALAANYLFWSLEGAFQACHPVFLGVVHR